MNLDELIERLEKAGAPNRELDLECWWWGKARHDGKHEMEPEYRAANLLLNDSPRYTASVDMALKLVPEDSYWVLGRGRLTAMEPMFGAQVWLDASAPQDDDADGEGESDATAAIAVCIAALKARRAPNT